MSYTAASIILIIGVDISMTDYEIWINILYQAFQKSKNWALDGILPLKPPKMS